MKKIKISVILIAAISMSGCFSEKSKFVDLCEQSIKKQLKSPSGYKLISKKVESKLLTPEEYIKKEYIDKGMDPEKELNVLEKEVLKNKEHRSLDLEAVIEYDAPNGFGALVRDIVSCTYVSFGDNIDSVSYTKVKLDGISLDEKLSNYIKSRTEKK